MGEEAIGAQQSPNIARESVEALCLLWKEMRRCHEVLAGCGLNAYGSDVESKCLGPAVESPEATISHLTPTDCIHDPKLQSFSCARFLG